MTSASPAVSVIIPVRDSAPIVAGLLDALERQTLPSGAWEAVIGDDGSTDDLAGVVGERRHVTIARGTRRNSYAARNRAVAHASASVLAFCDADCIPDPRWLEEGLEALEDADVVGGHVSWRLSAPPTIWTVLGIEMFIDQGRAVRGGNALGGNLFVRRALFEELGGFDETLPSQGDFDFVTRCVAAGARLAYARDAIVSHPTYVTASEVLRKSARVNRAYASREARAGRVPSGIRFRAWVPFVQTVRTRRYFGQPLGLNRQRLAESGIQAGISDQMKALPFIYVVLPYLRNVAQLVGFLEGRRARQARPGGAEP